MHRPNQPTDQLHSTKRTTPRRSRKLRTLLALGTFVGVGAVLTTAAFSDHVEMRTTFTAGSLDINVDGQEGNPTPFNMGAFPGGDSMTPGDTVVHGFTVNNEGSLPAHVWVTTQDQPSPDPGNPLGDLKLQAVEYDKATETCDEDLLDDWTTTTLQFNADLIAQEDAMEIPAGGSQDLCVAVHLPSDTSGTGGGNTNALFRFFAES